MSEKPIKLFSSLAERYPEPESADTAQTAVRGLISIIPGVGSPINEVLSLVLAPSVSRRRDAWFKELADVVEELRSKHVDVGDLANNEAFVSAMIQATRIAASTNKDEKRTILRNALLNVALGKGPDEDTQHIFLNVVDAFTASHVRVLDVLWRGAGRMNEKLWDRESVPITRRNYRMAIELLVPELKGQTVLLDYIMNDLRNRTFTQFSALESGFPQGNTITNMGIQFIRFVLNPNELS